MNWLDFNDAAPQTSLPTLASAPVWSAPKYARDDVFTSIIPRLESVLGYLYPNGFADPKARAFYIGDKAGSPGQSLNVVLQGERAGLWHDFATGEGGDIFDLWGEARGLKSFSDVLTDAGAFVGAGDAIPRRTPKRQSPVGGNDWGAPSVSYSYRDPNGNLIAQVDRFDWIKDGEAKKSFRPWNVEDRKYCAPTIRPLYNLPEVVRSPEIILCEGEKCADALIKAGIVATTAMGGSNAPIEATDWTPLKGHMVAIWPDNDDTGIKYAERAREAILRAGAITATVLRIPAGKPPKWDAADAAQDGENLLDLLRQMRGQTAEAERTGAPVSAPFQSWSVIDPASLAQRQFLYGKHYIRKFASVTVAPGGLGKSTLVLAESIAMATGEPVLGIRPKQRCKVVYFNAEDPLDEIQRRVIAICQHHDIPQSKLVGWIFTASGRETELILSRGDIGEIVEPVFEVIERFCEAESIDVVAFDPLANMTESPETNDVFRRLGKRVSLMADRLNISVELVHHTRKLNGNEATVEDSRGGSALIGAVRAARALNPMTADEAAKAGLETHIDHFRIEAAGKNNLSRGDSRSTWFTRVSVPIANGDEVASVETWQWPDALEGVTADDARKIQSLILGCSEPPRASTQSRQWVGLIIADVLGMDTTNKAEIDRIKVMIKEWIKTDVLRQDTVLDRTKGRDIPVVVVGSNRFSEV